jgi:pyruvate-formate lyase-activating enzyme
MTTLSSVPQPETIRICARHEYVVPLIFTFAFMGCEYWCPYCGNAGGFLEMGETVPATQELVERLKKYIAAVKPYLKAISALSCDRIEYPEGSGLVMKPSELPPEVIKEFMQIREKGWELGQEL